MRFVGAAGEQALREVLPFLDLVSTHLTGEPQTVLDFGAGWGRIARFFDGPQMLLADVDKEALDLCARLGVKGKPLLLTPNGPLPLRQRSVDFVYAYSVFSHLSEANARHWLGEISRVLRPGGVFAFTTQSERFINLVAGCAKVENPTQIQQQIGRYLRDPDQARETFRRGEHVFSGTGGGGVLEGDFYGWAAVPPKWVEANATSFEILRYVDDPRVLEQAVFVLRKRELPSVVNKLRRMLHLR